MQAVGRPPQRAPDGAPIHYERHRPEQTTLYRLVQQHAAGFIAHTEASTGAELPRFIKDEFDAFLECGILAHGFLRLRCGECGHDKLLAFSCKRRGFCPSCGARRMSQTAAHLVDHVIPHVPVRQWVLSLPIPLRVLLAAQPELVTPVLQVVQRVVARHLLEAAGLKADEGHGGAVTLIQRFGSAANLNIHLHCLVLDGVYRCDADGLPSFLSRQPRENSYRHPRRSSTQCFEVKAAESLRRGPPWPIRGTGRPGTGTSDICRPQLAVSAKRPRCPAGAQVRHIHALAEDVEAEFGTGHRSVSRYSGSSSVGTCRSGLSRANSASAEAGSADAALAMRYAAGGECCLYGRRARTGRTEQDRRPGLLVAFVWRQLPPGIAATACMHPGPWFDDGVATRTYFAHSK